MKANPKARLNHIIDTISLIESFKPVDLTDEITFGGVVYRLQIIGEALKHVPNDWLKTQPHIRWKSIMAFRNYAVHEYFQLDIKAIEDAINNLPELSAAIKKIHDTF